MNGEAARPREHIGRLFAWLRQRFCRQVWVERSGGSIEYGDVLQEQWPDAKFVYLVRDGRDTAYSMAGHPMFRVRLARILSGCAALPVEACLRAEIPYHRFGAYWSALMFKAHRLFGKQSAEDVLVLRYEELMKSPVAVLRSLAAFVTDADAPGAWLDQARALIAPAPCRWTSLPRAEREALDAACRPGMRCVRRWTGDPVGLTHGTV
jgi:putative sulfotransferase